MEQLKLERKIAGHLDQSLHKTGPSAFAFVIATHEVENCWRKQLDAPTLSSVFQAEQMPFSACPVLQPLSVLAPVHSRLS